MKSMLKKGSRIMLTFVLLLDQVLREILGI
jgi:hypothetical protein